MKEYVVFLDRATLYADLRFPEFDHTWVEYPHTPPAEMVEALWRASIVIVHRAYIPREVIASCHKLKLIVALAAEAKNHVDLEACAARDIKVHALGEGPPASERVAMQALGDRLIDFLDAYACDQAKA